MYHSGLRGSMLPTSDKVDVELEDSAMMEAAIGDAEISGGGKGRRKGGDENEKSGEW